MKEPTYRGLYIACLQDIRSAEEQILNSLPDIAAGVTCDRLSEAIEEHVSATRIHLERIDALLKDMEVPRGHQTCLAVGSFLTEADKNLDDGYQPAVADAAVLGSIQKLAHYEIATYESAARLANHLDLDDHCIVLQVTLEEEYNFDDTLAEIMERAKDYFQMGVPVCWIINPVTRQGWIATAEKLTEVTDGVLRAGEIEMPLAEVIA